MNILRAGFFGLKKSAAPGVEGLTWTQYEKGFERGPPVDGIFRRRMGGVERWALPAAGQDCPSGGGGDPDACLRDGVPGVQLRVPGQGGVARNRHPAS